MGWSSATQIFDEVIAAADEMLSDTIVDEASAKEAEFLMERFADRVADELRDGDWDCEDDSKYFERFHNVLCWACRNAMSEDCYIANPD